VLPPPDLIAQPLCHGLRPIFPAEEREIGTFSIVLTAARPMAIDVRPWHDENEIPLRGRRRLPVAVLGSSDLDVREIVPASLRLGDGEAPPATSRLKRRALQLDVDRDGKRDLLSLFSVRDAQIDPGDRLLCLLARDVEGTLLEGCDAIEPILSRRGRGRRR